MPIELPQGWPRFPMWEAVLPEVADDLRQGDLLADLAIPSVKVPVSTTTIPAASGAYAILPAPEHKLAMVVSQCCQNERGDTVSVSPVISSTPVKAEDMEKWLREEPGGDQDVDYVYDLFCLAPIQGLLTHRQMQFNNGDEGLILQVANLAKATPVTGDWPVIRSTRVARMTPFGRHLLRTKLAFHWSRGEALDLVALEELLGPR
jgi:hypothetical protein